MTSAAWRLRIDSCGGASRSDRPRHAPAEMRLTSISTAPPSLRLRSSVRPSRGHCAAIFVMPDPAGCEHLARRGGGRGCRSWSSTPRGGRGAPGRSECRDRAPGDGWRKNGGRCGNWRACRCPSRERRGSRHAARLFRGSDAGPRWSRSSTASARERPIASASRATRTGTCG